MRIDVVESGSDGQALLALLQTSDSSFPTGTFSHSFGLETMVELGVVTDASGLEDFLNDVVLDALATCDMPLFCKAYSAAANHEVRELMALSNLARDLKGSSELRAAGARVGAQKLKMISQLWPHPLMAALTKESADRDVDLQAVVVSAAFANITGQTRSEGMLAWSYQALSSQVAAAYKLIRIGQNAGQQILTRTLAKALLLVEKTAWEEVEPGGFTLLSDLASARHEHAYTRLFIS